MVLCLLQLKESRRQNQRGFLLDSSTSCHCFLGYYHFHQYDYFGTILGRPGYFLRGSFGS
jgi:hypothetical protein